MAIYNGSRYVGSSVTQIILEDGERRPYIHSRPPYRLQARVGAVNEVFGIDDSLDLMAVYHLGAEDNWWVIADSNNLLFPEVDESEPEGPNSLFMGRRLLIPTKGTGS